MSRNPRSGMACAIGALLMAAPSLAQVMSVTVSGGVLGDRVALEQVGVQRGAATLDYAYGDLISPTLDGVNIPSATSRTLLLYANPLDGNRDQALSDQYVNTGFFDQGAGNGSFAPGSEFVQLGFAAPVVNDEGPDLLVFGIGFDFDFGPALFSSSYLSFDGSTAHPLARDADFVLGSVDPIPYYAYAGGVTSPADLVSALPGQTGSLGNPPTAVPKPVIHALDLSDFGIAAGASINTLYLQDDASDSRDLFPTLVAGLPAIPEPTVGAMVIMGSFMLLRRRRD